VRKLEEEDERWYARQEERKRRQHASKARKEEDERLGKEKKPAEELNSQVPERRIDHMLGDRAVTYEEMVNGLAHEIEKMTPDQLKSHWSSLKIAKQAAGNEVYRGPGVDFCADSGGVISEGESSGKDECQSRCAADGSCHYFSLWTSGGVGWCRLSRDCDELSQQSEHTIYIYHKAAAAEKEPQVELADTDPVKAKPPNAKPAKVEPPQPEVTKAADTDLFKGPGMFFCADSNGVISKSESLGKDACKWRCEADPSCQYYSLWATGGVNWCSLTKACHELGQEPDHSIRIYRRANSKAHTEAKQEAKAAEESKPAEDKAADAEAEEKEVAEKEAAEKDAAEKKAAEKDAAKKDLYKGPGVHYCADSNGLISKSKSSGKSECKARCAADSSCHFFSLWATGGVNWCHLSKACDELSEEPEHSINIYRKARVEADRAESVVSEPPEAKPADAEAQKAQAKDIDDQMEKLIKHSGAIDRLKQELAKAKEKLLVEDKPAAAKAKGTEPARAHPAEVQPAPAADSKAELAEADQAKGSAEGMSYTEKIRADRHGAYTQLHDMDCGWAGSWDDPKNSCGMSNQAYIDGEERSRANVAREQVLDICGHTCTEAGEKCDGFMWQASTSTCFFRKNTKCGVSKSTGNVCFQKSNEQ